MAYWDNPDFVNLCCTFGRGEKHFCCVKTIVSREDLPLALNNLFVPGQHAQYFHNVALGDAGVYYAGYIDVLGATRCLHSCLPRPLQEWIGTAENPKRHVPSLRVTLGPNGRFFAMDRAGYTHSKIPSDMQAFLDKEDFIYKTGGPRIVAFGPGQSYMIVLKNGSYSYDLRDNSMQLDQEMDRLCNNRVHALDGLIFFSLSCYKPEIYTGLFKDKQSGQIKMFGDFSEEWHRLILSLTETKDVAAEVETKIISPPPQALHDGVKGCQICYKYFEKDAKTYFCPQCAMNTCAPCFEDGKHKHEHKMVRLFLCRPDAPDDFWKTGFLPQRKRFCDLCKGDFFEVLDSHVRCKTCTDFDVCQGCLDKDMSISSLKHGQCPFPADMLYLDPVEKGTQWAEDQVAKLQAHLESVQAEQQKTASSTSSGNQKTPQPGATLKRTGNPPASTKPSQKPPPPKASTQRRAPAPQPRAPVVRQAQAQPRTVRRNKPSSGLSFLNNALRFTTAVLNAENAANGGWSGGGGGGGGGGGFVNTSGTMDMSSFWAPINSAASDPIQ